MRRRFAGAARWLARRRRGVLRSFMATLLGGLCQWASACDPDASVLFACEASAGKKYIELCASSPVDQPDGYLEYRFGALGRDGRGETVELSFPPSREGSLKRFVGATYTHGGTYTQSVSFKTDRASYAVFTDARGSQTVAAGVRVRDMQTNKVVTVACNERPRFYIHELQHALACDPQTPVGRACIR